MGETDNYLPYVIGSLIISILIIIIITVIITSSGPWSGSCVSNSDCLNSERCVQGTCLTMNGYQCQDDQDCVSGYCGTYKEGTKTCQNRPDNPKTKVVISKKKPQTKEPEVSKNKYEMTVTLEQPNIKHESKPVQNRKDPTFEYVPTFDVFSEEDITIDYSDRTGGSNTPIILSGDSSCYSEDRRYYRAPTSQIPWYQRTVQEPFNATVGGNFYVTSGNGNIIDVINYSNSLICLYNDGSIRSTDKRITIRGVNGRITALANHNGYLIILAKGKLYRLLTSTYRYSNWEFEPYLDEYEGISDISYSLDNNILAVKIEDKLYIIGDDIKVENHSVSKKRVYGYQDRYIDIDLVTKEAIENDGKVHQSVLDAAIDSNGEVIILRIDEAMTKGFMAVKIVNWDPYYLKSV